MRVEIFYHLNDLDKETWDKLNYNGSVFYNYGWFESFESEVSEEHIYLVAKDGERTVGILPGFVVRDPKTYIYHNPRDIMFSSEFIEHAVAHKKDGHVIERSVYRSLVLLRPLLNFAFLPALVFISPLGYVGDIIADQSNINFPEIMICLIQEAERLAIDMGMKGVILPWVPVTNKALTAFLKERSFIPSYGKPICELKINWS